MLINENFLWLILVLIICVNFFKLFEKFCVINVVLVVKVIFIIFSDGLIEFCGVFFVLNLVLLCGEVCFFVNL